MWEEYPGSVLMKQICDELEKHINNELRLYDLTMSQLGILGILHESDGHALPLKELEKRFRVAQSTAAGIVTRLEQKGFLDSYVDAGDRRVKIVRMTEKGEKFCSVAEEDRRRFESRFFTALTESEQSTLVSLLTKVRDSLSEM